MRTQAIAVLAAASLGTPAIAQTIPDAGIVIEVDQTRLLPGQSTRVTMAAAWPEPFSFKIAGVATDLNISTGPAGWSDIALIAPMDGPGTTPGVLAASGVEGILAGQLHFPPGGGCPFGICPERPTLFWGATYTAPADPAAPFEVDLLTDTSRFDVYTDPTSGLSVSVLDQVVEGQATIRVVPAPAGASLFVLGLAGTAMRKRDRAAQAG